MPTNKKSDAATRTKLSENDLVELEDFELIEEEPKVTKHKKKTNNNKKAATETVPERREGVLLKKTQLKHNWVTRYYVVDNHNLTYWTTKEDMKSGLPAKGEIQLINAKILGTVIRKGVEEQLLFNVRTVAGDSLFKAENVEDKAIWIDALRSQVVKRDVTETEKLILMRQSSTFRGTAATDLLENRVKLNKPKSTHKQKKMEGFLTKKSKAKHNWIERYYVLNNNTLFYWLTKEDRERGFQPKGKVILLNAKIAGTVVRTSGAEDPLLFNVRTFEGDNLFKVKNLEQKAQWIDAIKTQIVHLTPTEQERQKLMKRGPFSPFLGKTADEVQQ